MLATNPRMFIVFGVLLLGQPLWYFIVEVTVCNIVLIYILRRHEAIFGALYFRLKSPRAGAVAR